MSPITHLCLEKINFVHIYELQIPSRQTDVDLMLFCRRWFNIENTLKMELKSTLKIGCNPDLDSKSVKQCWINVRVTTYFQHWFYSIFNVFSMLNQPLENNVNSTSGLQHILNIEIYCIFNVKIFGNPNYESTSRPW